MVQFLLNFFSWISSIFVRFLKNSRFFLSLCIIGDRSIEIGRPFPIKTFHSSCQDTVTVFD